MVIHEKHCTMNPDRVCRFCAAMEAEQQPMAELLAMLPPRKECSTDYGGISITTGEHDLDAVRRTTENCPACILAVIRQSGGVSHMYGFDFKKEGDEFWRQYNGDHQGY